MILKHTPAMKPVKGQDVVGQVLSSSLGWTLIVGAAVLLGGCATSSPRYAVDDGARPLPSDRDQGRRDEPSGQVRSSNERNDSWGDAFSAPLEDLNLKRTAIPAILERAITKPYDLTGLDHCEQIAAEVRKLDSLLGEDFDEPPPPPDNSTIQEKGGRAANSAAVDAVRGATRSIIPFRGIVRQVTGADKHQKELDKAIQAGKVRRAYLKGVGMNKNCAPPAAPSWFVPRVYVETYVPGDSGKTSKSSDSKKKRSSKKHR